MNYTVILLSLFALLSLAEAGKKGNKKNVERPSKVNSWGCPSKKTLKLKLSQLERSAMNGVFVVPIDNHALRDGTEVVTSRSYTDRPNVGWCKEETYLNYSSNRIPETVLATRCICMDCQNAQGDITARCDPIHYQHNVFFLPERKSEKCVQGLLHYEEVTENVTVGCKYTVF